MLSIDCLFYAVKIHSNTHAKKHAHTHTHPHTPTHTHTNVISPTHRYADNMDAHMRTTVKQFMPPTQQNTDRNKSGV